MGSQKLLQEWCRLQCENYPNVEIRDLTTSFKDGLAFCAIIHKNRPDLLDFHSLSKDKGYENNRLAFEVAETHLGIQALLDPADMVSAEVPDRLSVITYLSQYLAYFGKTSDADFSSFLMTSLPSSCKAEKKGQRISETSAEKRKDLPNSRAPSQLCSACQKHVHLVQRHIVDGKMYHRSCFKCSQCSSTLFAGSYTKGETGSLLCSHLCIQKPNGQPKLPSLADPGESLQGVRSQDVPSCSTSLTEKHSVEVDKEKQKESQLLENTDEDQQCINSIGAVEDKTKTLSAKQLGTAKTEGKQNLEKEKLVDVDTKKLGVSASTDFSPTLAGQLGTNSRPVPAPRRAKARQQEPSTSNPPWPPPKAHPVKVMKRSMSENHENKSVLNPGEEASSLSRSESQKPKSPPWLDLVHPGPWTKLPPVAPPPQPSRSCSVPFLSEMWSRRKAVHLTSMNPFDEEDLCDDLEGSHRDTWTVCSERDESQVEMTMVTSQTWCGSSGQDQANIERLAKDTESTEPGAPQSAECTDTALASKGESISEEKGVECSTEDSKTTANCLSAQANAAPNKTDPLEKSTAEANGTANVAQPACSSGVSDLAETAGSVCSLNLAEVVTVPEASRLDSSAGTTELESLPKFAVASSPHTVSETNVCKKQELSKSLSEVQLSSPGCQNILSSNVASSSPSASCSDAVDHSQSSHQRPSDGMFKDRELMPPPIKPNRNKRTCKENPFNRAASLAEIPSSTAPSSSSSSKAAAPGHGFPLIKRRVQTDRFIPSKELQTERGELERRLDGLEKRGVELEKSLRNCHNEKEDALLVNWFKLIHEKHMLVRRDAELVYMAKQQNLEERQSDVEYELRCLFNKPEKAWSKEDKAREKQLMSDLVTIIEQRNQIINSLDQDRQREQEEDMLLEDMIKKRDFLRNAENDPRIFGGKFKPMKILKQLSHKTESKKGKSKSSVNKK